MDFATIHSIIVTVKGGRGEGQGGVSLLSLKIVHAASSIQALCHRQPLDLPAKGLSRASALETGGSIPTPKLKRSELVCWLIWSRWW